MLGQKCFTSGVHFSEIFSVPKEINKEKAEILEKANGILATAVLCPLRCSIRNY